MRLLILGGTKFVGRHITNEALARGHSVTLFNRGQTNAELFPDTEKIHGNRDGGLESLGSGTWDAVLDVNGYLPRLVGDSARALKARVPHYLFISTESVYLDAAPHGQNEDAPLETLEDPTTETIDGKTYGGLKVLCEQVVRELYPDKHTILRFGFVVGPNDHTDRWTSWVRRAAAGGEMLAPGESSEPIQFIDGRDVAKFALNCVERGIYGTYNTTGPAAPLSWGEFLNTVKQVSGADTRFTWVNEEFIAQQELADDLPMWVSRADGGLMRFDTRRAKEKGLTYLPLTETIEETLIWDRTHGTPRAGFSKEREAELLRQWHEAND